MDEKVESDHLDSREGQYHQRYFKLTHKGRAPKVTRVWPAVEKSWYIRYAYDFIILLISIALVFMRAAFSRNEWISFSLEVLLAGFFYMWLTTLTTEGVEK
jgi:hypothetical protein